LFCIKNNENYMFQPLRSHPQGL